MWGVIRYGHRKAYTTTARSMALEAGSAFHDMFAAIRLWQLAKRQGLPDHCRLRGERLFGIERWNKAWFDAKDEEPRSELMQLCFNILHSGDFYDDPKDNIRTLTNIETSIIRYIDEQMITMDAWEIYVADVDDPKAFTGVEVTFDLVVEYTDKRIFRYCGMIDAVYRRVKTGELYPFENKSAIRLDDGWRQAFVMSHQQTGYCIAVSTILQLTEPLLKFRVVGLKSKQTGHVDDYAFFEETRKPEDFFMWADWFRHSVETYERYHDDWENSPRYTHSCNRYFRPCALLLFCGDDAAGRKEQFDDMVEAPLSPSEESALLHGV